MIPEAAHNSRVATPDSAEVTKRIDQWSKRHPFAIWALGSRATLVSMTAEVSHLFQVDAEYEERKTQAEVIPYAGGPIDGEGTPPLYTDIFVAPPATFGDFEHRLPIPHTDHVETCDRCTGHGRHQCSDCVGRGKVECRPCSGRGFTPCTCFNGYVTCSMCGGRGYTESTSTTFSTDSDGNSVSQTSTDRTMCSCFNGQTRCPWCNGDGKKRCMHCSGTGIVTCTACGGQGDVTCEQCEGHGNVLHQNALYVRHFHARFLGEWNPPEVPKHVSGGLATETCFKTDFTNTDGDLSQIPAEAFAVYNGLVEESSKHGATILFRSAVGKIQPSWRLLYSKDGHTYELWLFRDANFGLRVLPVKFPFSYLRIALTAVAAIAVVTGLVMLALSFTQSPPAANVPSPNPVSALLQP